ncbi:MAG: hypothetical protein CFH17_01171 [Alphaproteobacteria bacterium MarineAlpha5_Bin7]|nr:MAG: hypothetical protein CFH17_01171 [Alphaproteobacteria bacterium MarineAlpha5_Bin7]
MSDFRFFDSRQKYLLFVTTTNEKTVISEKISPIIKSISPVSPGLKIFDAGLGDGTLLMNVLRDCHRRFPTVPFIVVGKEVSMEDVRLTIEKLPDRFVEHPNMVFVFNNLHYSESTSLKSKNPEKQKNNVWETVSLEGNSSYEFNSQLSKLDPILEKNWQVEKNPKNGNTTYKNPAVIVIYRKDQHMSLNHIIPRESDERIYFDLIIASQPYRSRISEKQKVNYVIKPMIESLNNKGKLIVTHSFGNDPPSELVNKLWPDDNPFPTLGKKIIEYLKNNLNEDMMKNLIFHQPDVFKYHLRSLPNEIEDGIATSLIFSAWNNINYVCQISDDKIYQAEEEGKYQKYLSEILKKNDGLFFNDEMILIEKK